MINFLVQSYGSVLRSFEKDIEKNWSLNSPESGFAKFICKNSLILPVFEQAPLIDDDIKFKIEQAPYLASLGFYLATSEKNEINTDLFTFWNLGFKRLTQRNPFPSDRASFFYRPVELLGIALGSVNNPYVELSNKHWLFETINEGEIKLAQEDTWAQIITKYSKHILYPTSPIKKDLYLNDLQITEKALLRWLVDHDEAFAQMMEFNSLESELNSDLLEYFLTNLLDNTISYHAALFYVSLKKALNQTLESEIDEVWQLNKEKKDAKQMLNQICRRFHRFAKEFDRRYSDRNKFKVEDEYDVQDLLRALLQIHFEDVRPEEWTPSYASSSSRIDFLLKKEQIIIEVKMTRKGLNQKELSNQLIIDKERYKIHPDCKILFCLIYDPKNICHNPVSLETDLSTDEEDLQTHVIVVPQ